VINTPFGIDYFHFRSDHFLLKSSKLFIRLSRNLAGIGINGFNEAPVEDSDSITKIMGQITDTVYISYKLDSGSETIVLKKFKDAVELLYEIKSLANPLMPQHELLLNYATPTDPNINIVQRCNELGFVDLDDTALFEWEDEFYPKMLE